ncbi:MAG: LptE family protein, partial [Deltaproteobacteria bacterium]|nr:LptE family protein [Deltaproteobacteria bacterium]
GIKNPWVAKCVKTVYIQVMTNNSLKAGIEIPFTTALAKEFESGGKVRVVGDEKEADAIVKGTIASFTSEFNPSGLTSVSSISNSLDAQALSDMVVASEYIATANITVQLIKRDGPVLWTQTFSRPKVYPAGNRFGLQGTTSALIDAPVEQLALVDIAGFIASDVHDTMYVW